MISCTGSRIIRVDKYGHGGWGSPRRKTDGTRYYHKGVDYIGGAGFPAFAPIDCTFERALKCYNDGSEYSGAILRGTDCVLKLLYMEPLKWSIGTIFKQGDIIGTIQDITKRYGPEMKNHMHQEVVQANTDIFVSML